MTRDVHPGGGFPHGTFPIWRLIAEKVATLTDIRGNWSITDVMDANDTLDYWGAQEQEAAK